MTAKTRMSRMLLGACIATARPAPFARAADPSAGAQPAQTFDSPQHAVDALSARPRRATTRRWRRFARRATPSSTPASLPATEERRDVAKAREQKRVSIDPKSPDRAVLVIGKEHWLPPSPGPRRRQVVVRFQPASRDPLPPHRRQRARCDPDLPRYVRRRTVRRRRSAATRPSQYAQRIISSDGKQDGLAEEPDGTWGGPIGQNVAKAIEEGYAKGNPYHGYFFKILKRWARGAARSAGLRREGRDDRRIALGRARGYRVTGVETFIEQRRRRLREGSRRRHSRSNQEDGALRSRRELDARRGAGSHRPTRPPRHTGRRPRDVRGRAWRARRRRCGLLRLGRRRASLGVDAIGRGRCRRLLLEMLEQDAAHSPIACGLSGRSAASTTSSDSTPSMGASPHDPVVHARATPAADRNDRGR
jgi:hypothetical protein